jgi:predicted XRE-type DNA-binding protein
VIGLQCDEARAVCTVRFHYAVYVLHAFQTKSKTGNVFADLGVAQPEEERAKARLASHIRAAIARRQLTRAQAASLIGLDQPKVSALMNGRLTGFSSDRLLRCMAALGLDVDIVVRGESPDRERGRVRVVGDVA